MENNSILIVDDNEINRDILSNLFFDEYNIIEAENGDEAIRMIKENKNNLAVMLLDINMPVKNGFEVLDYMRFRRYNEDIPVIMISASDSKGEIEGLKRGASDFITKPFDERIVKQRVKNAIELYTYKRNSDSKLNKQSKQLAKITDLVTDVLLTAMRQKNSGVDNSVKRIKEYTKLILNYICEYSEETFGLNEEKIEQIAAASVLHNIGELSLDEDMTEKNKHLMSAADKLKIESHTERGCQIIESISNVEKGEYINYALEICRNHHERWDGSGYPNQLIGNEIPLSAQVVGLADTYDALRKGELSDHPFNGKEAVEIITRGDYSAFSPFLAESVKMLEDRLNDIFLQYPDN